MTLTDGWGGLLFALLPIPLVFVLFGMLREISRGHPLLWVTQIVLLLTPICWTWAFYVRFTDQTKAKKP